MPPGAHPAEDARLLLVQDMHIRVINTATGELLRDLTRPSPHLLTQQARPGHAETQGPEP